jgi:uncharacterized membrane protein YqjE
MPQTEDRSVAELVGEISEQVSRLVRDELRLARAEMTEKGKRAGVGAGLFGGAGVVALYGVAALLVALVLGLAEVMPAWVAALLVAVLLFIGAAVLALVGRRNVRQATPPVPEQAMESVKADVAEVKERAQR